MTPLVSPSHTVIANLEAGSQRSQSHGGIPSFRGCRRQRVAFSYSVILTVIENKSGTRNQFTGKYAAHSIGAYHLRRIGIMLSPPYFPLKNNAYHYDMQKYNVYQVLTGNNLFCIQTWSIIIIGFILLL